MSKFMPARLIPIGEHVYGEQEIERPHSGFAEYFAMSD